MVAPAKLTRRSALGLGGAALGSALTPPVFAARSTLKPGPPTVDWQYPLPPTIHALYTGATPLENLSDEDRAALVADLSGQALASPNGLGIPLPDVIVETLQFGGTRLLAPRLLIAGPDGKPSDHQITVFSSPLGNQHVLVRVRRDRWTRAGSYYGGGQPRLSNDLLLNVSATEYSRDNDALAPVASVAVSRSAANSWLVPPLVSGVLNSQVLYARLQTTKLSLDGPNTTGMAVVNNIAPPEVDNRAYLSGGDALTAASGEGRGLSDAFVLSGIVPGLTRADLSVLEFLPRVVQVGTVTHGGSLANDTYVNLRRGATPDTFVGDVVSVEWNGTLPRVLDGIGRVVYQLHYESDGTITTLDYGIEHVPGLSFDLGTFPSTIIKAGEYWKSDYLSATTQGGLSMRSVSWPALVMGAHPAYHRIPFR